MAQPDYTLFHYVAKMATVEYEKCASIHTSWFDRLEYTIRVLSVLLFAPILIGKPYVLKLRAYSHLPCLVRTKPKTSLVRTFWAGVNTTSNSGAD